ncbi:MAG: hypothetical protein NTX28_07680 [Novosphingobium sp.]|nr:hypothetical protein [Novosphingobium sp.]
MVNAAKNAASPDLRPPAHVQLSANAEPYFADIVRARAREEWNEHQLTVAAQMAECMVDQDEVRAELLLEGRVTMNERGTRVANPLVSISEQLARRQMALGRSLQMIGRATGDPRAPTAKRKLEAGARKLRDEVEQEEDSLLK